MFTQIDFSQKERIVYSQDAWEAIKVGYQRHMRFRVIGNGEVPVEPYYQDGWWYEILKPETIIPSEARNRLELLDRAGIKTIATLIAHEVPKDIPAPTPESKSQIRKEPLPTTTTHFDLIPLVEKTVGVLGATVAGILTVLGFCLIAAIEVDPAIIVVLPDGTWLEIMTYYQ